MALTFSDFWASYPSRKGTKAKAMAEKRFNMAVKKGADPAYIVSSAKKYRDEAKEEGNIDTPFVCLASTWLNQQRWLDYLPDDGERDAKMNEDMAKRGYRWNGNEWEKINAATHQD